ncbi:MAG TPA: isochorismatase family protein [Planosporangium sp.]|nr:isochorismatase family protein [Planosporangium sp.]
MTTQTGPVGALIVVDAQAAFVAGEGAVPAAEPLLEEIMSLVARARAGRAVVVYLQNDGPVRAVDEPGKPGWQLHLPVREGRDEVVIRKVADDGFDNTDLAGLLTGRGVRRLAICGVMSEMCVSATVRTALNFGFGVVMPHDAHATYDIPAAPDISDVVAAAVSWVAEWALGDQIEVVPHASGVNFVAPGTLAG